MPVGGLAKGGVPFLSCTEVTAHDCFVCDTIQSGGLLGGRMYPDGYGRLVLAGA